MKRDNASRDRSFFLHALLGKPLRTEKRCRHPYLYSCTKIFIDFLFAFGSIVEINIIKKKI